MQRVPAVELGAQPHADNSAPASGVEQPLFRLDIRRAYELHRRLILGFAIAGLVLAIAYVAKTWPVYSAQSQIYIQPNSGQVLSQGNNQQHWPYDSNSYDSFIQQQVQIATDPDVLMNALHRLPPGSFQHAGESDQIAAERLGHAVKVERMGSSYQVAIIAKAKSPELAAQIADAVANSVVQKAAHQENAGDPQRIAILQAERDRVQRLLNADLAEQSLLNKQLGMAAVGDQAPDLIDNAIGATRTELIQARTNYDAAAAKYATVVGNGASTAALDAQADALIAADPGLTSMKTSLDNRRATLIAQMANLTPRNPEYKLDAQELEKINQSLNSMMQELRAQASARIKQNLRTELESTASIDAQLNGQLHQLAETAASATPKLQRANDLINDIARLRTRYAAVDGEMHNLMLQNSVPGAVHLSVAAVVPLHPAVIGVVGKALLLFVGGIFLGLMAALLANNLDPKLYIASDIEALLGFAPMATLPEASEVSEEVFNEHVFRLSATLEHACAQSYIRNCIFTGAETGAGVSTLISKVGGMLEAMGRPVTLARASDTAQLPPRSDSGNVSQDEAGSVPTRQRASHSVALMQRASDESAQREHLVLTDTAPLMISAEAEYLARFADCVIVVLQSGITTRHQLCAIANTLQRINVPTVGFVLSRVSLAKADAAFRQTVHDMESRLRIQGRSLSQRPLWNDHSQPELAETSHQPAPGTAPVIPTISEPSQETAAAYAAPFVPELSAAPAAPTALPNLDGEIPWWLAESSPGSFQSRAAQFAPSASQLGPIGDAHKTEQRLPIKGQHDIDRPESLLGDLREAVPSFDLSKLVHYTRSTQREEAFFTPGASPIVPPLEHRSHENEIPRIAKAQAFTPAPDPAPAADVSVANPAAVTAVPEFLPPPPPVAGKEYVWEGKSRTRRDTREPVAEPRILPSWRGQYKRTD